MPSSRVLTVAGLLMGFLSLSPAIADTRPWYIGVGAGASTYGGPRGDETVVQVGELNPPSFTATRHVDRSATAFRLDAGYRCNRYFALEGAYADFGPASASLITTSPNRHYTDSNQVNGEGLNAVGLWPMTEKFELFGRVGLFHYHSDMNVGYVNVDYSTTPTPSVVSAGLRKSSTSGTTADIGAGIDYSIDERLAVRLALDCFRSKAKSPTSASPTQPMPAVHLVSVELLYNF